MKITWLPRAHEDIVSIRNHIMQHSLGDAQRIVLALYSGAHQVAEMPLLGRQGKVEYTRELRVPHTPYILVYTIIKRHLYVLAIIHEAQEWPENF